MKKVLVLNAGSSSIKYRLFDLDRSLVLASGLVERIGEADGRFRQQWREENTRRERDCDCRVADHREGLAYIAAALRESGWLERMDDLYAIGHRVVHGGEAFRRPTRIDARVVETIRALAPLAPLHNPANLTGIEVALAAGPEVPQVAVFDTAFHQTMPPRAYRYALPERIYRDYHVRRYGFHGTSHRYVARRAAETLGRPLAELRLITLHLGNGASAAALRGGECIDTSMGLTPLEGLVMGTRSGDLDPAVPLFLQGRAGLEPEQVDTLLNRDSGLKGICGVNDMREVQRRADAGDAKAELAIDMVCYRLKKYIGAYTAALGRLDALVFTGGIGEHSARVRGDACADLEVLGIHIDAHRNRASVPEPRPGGIRPIHADPSPVKVLVVPTDEELEIALQTIEAIAAESG